MSRPKSRGFTSYIVNKGLVPLSRLSFTFVVSFYPMACYLATGDAK